MLKHRVVAVVCLLVGITLGNLLPRVLSETADAGTVKVLCVGTGISVTNTTLEVVSMSDSAYDAAGNFLGADNDVTIDPHGTFVGGRGDAFAWIVEAPKGLRALGTSATQGYSDCVKTK